MKWKKVIIYTNPPALDIVCGLLVCHGLQGMEIEDATEFCEFLAHPPVPMDGVITDLLAYQHKKTAVIFYLPDTPSGSKTLSTIQHALPTLRLHHPTLDFGSLHIEIQTLQQQDWDVAWKQYYHPIEVTKRLIICPTWEKVQKTSNQVVVYLDPGMAFGTGTHETTRLCLQLLESCRVADSKVLDVGTGSGILAISALLLGATSVIAIDIDPLSVEIAKANAQYNKVADRLFVHCGNLAQQETGLAEIICANIVADVIIELMPVMLTRLQDQGHIILSGIIAERKLQILELCDSYQLSLVDQIQENDWYAFRFKKDRS